MPSSPLTIVRLNIEHFERLLREETDPVKRKTISELLAEEQAKLKDLLARERK